MMALSILLMMNRPFTVSTCLWHEESDSLSHIRRCVFINEQKVPEELEWDSNDISSTHILAFDKKMNPIACARLTNNGQIGRMAVLKEWRQLGVGTALIMRAIQTATAFNYPSLQLDSQLHAITFYERFGFSCYGNQFLDAGIKHIKMQLSLNSAKNYQYT